MTATYVFGGRTASSLTHHQTLGTILDPYTMPRIVSLVGTLDGLACLEVGCGSGSVARWMAAQVGKRGRVVATDLNPQQIQSAGRLTVLTHDITQLPVPQPPYDLIHARLVLMHLRERETVLRMLANALVPGGVLLIEDWDLTWLTGRMLRAPYESDRALFGYYHDTLIDVFREEEGLDPGWAQQVPGLMIDIGLRDVQAHVHAQTWLGGEPGCMMVLSAIAQAYDRLVMRGMTPQDLDRLRELMMYPGTMVRSQPLISTAGWR